MIAASGAAATIAVIALQASHKLRNADKDGVAGGAIRKPRRDIGAIDAGISLGLF